VIIYILYKNPKVRPRSNHIKTETYNQRYKLQQDIIVKRSYWIKVLELK